MDRPEQQPSDAVGALESAPSDGAPTPAPTRHRNTFAVLPIGNVPEDMLPLVAVLDAGRSLNRLRFHLEQAWFGYGNRRRAGHRALGHLGRTVRNFVPAADRRGFQEAVILPFEDLFKRISSEEHYLYFEDWTGEFGDEQLTDEDFRRALEPAFDAIAAARRSIEGRLDGESRLVFELGELLDRGTCPLNVHRHLRRPRPAPGLGEGEVVWGSVRPGDEEPDAGWYEDVRQLLIELAIPLGLRADTFAIEPTDGDGAIVAFVVRLVEGVKATLITLQARRREDIPVEPPLEPEPPDDTNPPAPEWSPDLVDARAFDAASHSGPEDFRPEPTSPNLQNEWDPSRISFNLASWTVKVDGKTFAIEDHVAFNVFKDIYKSTCDNERVTGEKLGKSKLKRLLDRWLPAELNSLIDRRDGNGGGYILRFPQESP